MRYVKKPIDLEQAEVLASRGLTLDQIAASFGVSTDTLHRRRRESAELEAAIRRGQSKGIAKVANSLYEQAMKGNVAAAIFYLKARANWSDRVELTHSGPEGGPVKFIIER